MKIVNVVRLSVCLIIFFMILSFTGWIPRAKAEPAQGPRIRLAMDYGRNAPSVVRRAQKKLDRMSKEEIRALDRKLARALTLYYDGEYRKALPLFKEISGKVETMDIKFWLGSCAYKAGESELAIKEFKEMLEVDPSLNRVRLELAAAYYQAEKYELSRKEFNRVLRTDPPEAVKENIGKYLARIEERSKRLFYNLRVSQGIQHDSNVSAGPSSETIEVPAGGILILDREEKELSDWVAVSILSGNLLYDLGERKGLMWNNKGFLYSTHNLDHHKFDYTRLRLASGPWWLQDRYAFKAPVSYSRDYFEHEDLYDTFEVGPNFEYFFHRNFSLKGTFRFSRDSYAYTVDHGKNNINREWEINPNLYFNHRNDIISFYGSHENLNAKDDWYSYDAFNVGASYFKRLPWEMEAYVRYKYSERDYESQHPAAVFMGWTTDREDERHNVYAMVSRTFWDYYFASVYFNWIENESNTPIYEFEKVIYGLRLGFKF